jgi:D-alanyl-D-alanine carboxypeptidase (penicillin-binding protein 5/6)
MTNVKFTLLILMSLCLSLVSEVSYSRHAAILIDADNGNVVYEQEANHAWFPASLTKVMTLYMTFSALSQGQVQLNDTMTASSYAARQPQSKLGLRTGESISVEEAILALVTRSANDAAVVLAEHLGGNEENFAARMTAKAHALGMFDTHFMNATGLPHQWQSTTARDLGLLAYRTMRDFPRFYPYFSAHSMFFRGREWKGINKFTASYPGAEGMKTGFTCGSGYNLISSAQQNGKRLIGVILGGMTSSERYQLMTQMMDNGFGGNLPASIDRHISAITAKTTGTPPYQLGCGHNAPRTSYAQYTPPPVRHQSHSRVIHAHSRHLSHLPARHLAASHKKTGHVVKVASRTASKSHLYKPVKVSKTKTKVVRLAKAGYHHNR